MEMIFCRRCGIPLEHINDHVYRCANGHTIFANSIPTVGVFFVTDDNQVLLSERGIEPHKGMLDSFGGFLDSEETSEQAAARELKEELGLDPDDYDELIYLCSGMGHYPYSGEIMPIVSFFYWTRLKPGKQPVPADDVAAIHTVPLFEIDLKRLHDDDIRIGIKTLQQVFTDR
jgi:ADP-ribose pyrophosphatase YjhB (NUDIX family)